MPLNSFVGIEDILTILVTVTGSYGLIQWRLKQSESQNENQWKYIHEIKESHSLHITDALTKRIEYEKRFGEIINSIGKVEIQYIEAEKRTRQIENKIDELSRKIDRMVEMYIHENK